MQAELQKRQTACSDFYTVICERPAKKPRLKLTCPRSGQTSTTAAPSGTLTKETRNTKWRWCRFVTGRYRNTSSVTDMLDYLGWETHEFQKNKAITYCLLQNRSRPDSHTTLQILDTSQQEDKSSTLFQVPSVPYIFRLFQIQLFPQNHPSMEQTASSCC